MVFHIEKLIAILIVYAWLHVGFLKGGQGYQVWVRSSRFKTIVFYARVTPKAC